MSDDICTNCGHWKGLHHFETNQCPAGGEAPVGRKQNWLMSIYQAPDKRDATIAAQAATIAQLWEALEDAKKLIYDHHEIGHIRRAHENPFDNCEACEKDSRLKKLFDAARALKGGE